MVDPSVGTPPRSNFRSWTLHAADRTAPRQGGEGTRAGDGHQRGRGK